MTEVIVLCYHALSRSWEAPLSTTPDRFERQLALLLGRGYRGVTFQEATRPRSGERAMAVTFDDAYRSVIELAYPILERHGIPATVFAPTDFIGSERPMSWEGIDRWLGGPNEPELTPMSWQELRTLAQAGWEVGSHSGSHPRLTKLDDATLADELERSKAACELHLPGPCTSIAYPYGDMDRRVAEAAGRAGYETAAALRSGLDRRGALDWPRIGIYNADGALRFRLKVSWPILRARRSPMWKALTALRGKGSG